MMIRLMVIIVAVSILFTTSVIAAELYENQTLLSEPRLAAKSAGQGLAGPVSVIERRGYWVQLKAGAVVGWTELEHVKMDETMQWMGPIDPLRDTGRLGAGR
ncbi:MAG: hypothetical protein Q9M17_06735 [Mariprofundus sp.]|nr:hypothetical protein [Mariprofundus sp.]